MSNYDLKQDPDSELEHDQKPSVKPSVHYPEDVQGPPLSSARPTSFPRFDSGFEVVSGSRTSSTAGTDDEDEEDDYDWSGEEDLVDEEAKFDKQWVSRGKTLLGHSRGTVGSLTSQTHLLDQIIRAAAVDQIKTHLYV